MLFCLGLAATGAFNGDRFVSGGIGAVIALVVVFVFYPVCRVLVGALEDSSGAFPPGEFWSKLASRGVWGPGCLPSSGGCGVAWGWRGRRCFSASWSGLAPPCSGSPSR